MSPGQDAAFFDQILDHLRQTRGFDFTAYKRTSLMRRVMKRMAAVNVGTFEQYLDYLQVHQDEFADLFDTILINVTSFFRDTDVWDHLSSEVIRRSDSAGDEPAGEAVRMSNQHQPPSAGRSQHRGGHSLDGGAIHQLELSNRRELQITN
jgi:CheR methyltransferase, all-alpha domain